MKLFDVVCLVLLGALLMTGLKVSCARDWTFEDQKPTDLMTLTQDCNARCGEFGGYLMFGKRYNPPRCFCNRYWGQTRFDGAFRSGREPPPGSTAP